MAFRLGWWLPAALAGAAALGVLYRFPPEQFGFYPVCPVHAITGLLCPGCGATRALAALTHGDLMGALRLNALAVALLGLGLGYVAVAATGRSLRVSRGWVLGLLVVCVAFTIWRNV